VGLDPSSTKLVNVVVILVKNGVTYEGLIYDSGSLEGHGYVDSWVETGNY
jgi:hypothetical protein